MHFQQVVLLYASLVLEFLHFFFGKVGDNGRLGILSYDGRHQAPDMAGRTEYLQKPEFITVLDNLNILFLVVLPAGTTLY